MSCADAGEPVVRPLLRRDAWRPRVRRSPPGHIAQRQAGLVSRPTASTVVPPFRPDVGDNLVTHLHRGSRPQLGRDPRDVQRRQLGPVARRQDHHLHGAHGAPGPAVPLRARRRLHGLRRLLLLDARSDRPEPLLHVDGLGRQRRQGRRAGHRQRRDRVQLDDVSGAPAGGRGSAGRSTRTSALGLDAAHYWGWAPDPYIGNYGDNSLLYFLSTRTLRPAARCTRGP